MKSLSFKKDLIGVQDELLRFAYKLTTDPSPTRHRAGV